jgi:hypothetical protein
MKNFNISSWFRDQYLTEAGLNSTNSQLLVNSIKSAMLQIDDSMSYKDFAEAVAFILINDYGTHNFSPFMKVLHSRLGMDVNESLESSKDILDEFLKYFKSYDAYTQYIDDGNQYKRAEQNNNIILNLFNTLSTQDKEIALEAVKNHFKDDPKSLKAFK